MASRRARSFAPTGTSTPALALHEWAARAEALLCERARLLSDIQKKKQRLAQVRERAEHDADLSTRSMLPLMARHEALLLELRGLFAELSVAGRLPKRTSRELALLRRSLELRGVLSPRGAEPAPDVAPRAEEPRANPRPRSAPPPHHHRPSPETASAAPAGQKVRSIRELFRSLARAVHPDSARHEAERLRRTELMKQVTSAYEQGDLARLLELEGAWRDEHELPSADQPEQRCRELQVINEQLLKQVRQLTRELRDTKALAREAARGMPPAELLASAEDQLDELESLCELLRRCRDGLATPSDLGPLTQPATRRRSHR
jgi:hypothetical protein